MKEILAIRDLISAEAGVHFGESRLHLLENCVKRRMDIAGIESSCDYFRFLTNGNLARHELQELVSISVTQETSFMRIPEHFQALAEEELPRLVRQRLAKGERHLRMWSAGTATGEEAYSLAITALSCGLPDWVEPSIIGTDIDPVALNHAREGSYRIGRIKNLSPATVWSHFERDGNDSYKVKESTRKPVTLFTHNLVTGHQALDMDVIFCRNVTIYFSHETRVSVLEKLSGCLKAGGVMMLGEAEIMPMQIRGLERRQYKSSLYYVKTGGAR